MGLFSLGIVCVGEKEEGEETRSSGLIGHRWERRWVTCMPQPFCLAGGVVWKSKGAALDDGSTKAYYSL